MDAQLIIYSIFYIIVSICLIYPPTEFSEAGFTINHVFSFMLGSEFENFVNYHIKRISLTLIIYSMLPLGYIFFLILISSNDDTYFLWTDENSIIWSIFATTTLIFPLAAFWQVLCWSYDDWKSHPVVFNLLKFSPNWKSICYDLNSEYRSIDKITIQSNAITKLIATENWLMKVSTLTFDICHHSDTSLLVVGSDVHELSMGGMGQNQFITIDIKTTRPKVANFTVRLNSSDFKDLEDRWGRAIPILPEVKFHKNITEKFVDAFKMAVRDNVKYSTTQALDLCIGCMQTRANVKLQRLCTTTPSNPENPPPADHTTNTSCANCYCRPLWCCECLGRWFASRQRADDVGEWLGARCTCPMCRATFCVLDVCYVNGMEGAEVPEGGNDESQGEQRVEGEVLDEI